MMDLNKTISICGDVASFNQSIPAALLHAVVTQLYQAILGDVDFVRQQAAAFSLFSNK